MHSNFLSFEVMRTVGVLQLQLTTQFLQINESVHENKQTNKQTGNYNRFGITILDI